MNLRTLYRKATYDWPLALGDWLHANLAVAAARILSTLTFKRTVLVLGAVALMIALAQAIPAPDAYLVAFDLMAYLDVASAVLLIAALARARVILAYARAVARAAIPRAREIAAVVRRYAARAWRSRVRSLMSTKKTSDDEPPALGWAFA